MSYWLDDYLKYTSNTEAPTVYHEWAGISVVAAVLQRKVNFVINVDPIYPNMFIAIVGPPGTRKGAALRRAKQFIDKLGIYRCAESVTKEQLVIELAQTNTGGEGPLLSGTIPLSDLLEDGVGNLGKEISDSEYCALSLIASELATFLNRGDDLFFTMLTEWFDCEESWTYKTKNKGKYKLRNIWFNMLGAITPNLVANTLGATAFGSGLISRFVFVYADKKSKIIFMDEDSIVGGSTKKSVEDEELFNSLINRLSDIQSIKGRFLMDQDAYQEYVKWRIKSEKDPPFGKNLRFEHYVDRRPTHLIKVAMIFACMRDDLNGQLVIKLEDLSRATELLERTENKMGLSFRGVGDYDQAAVLSKLVRMLAGNSNEEKSKKFTVNELYANFLNELSYVDFMRVVESTVKAEVALMFRDKTTGVTYISFNEKMRDEYNKGLV